MVVQLSKDQKRGSYIVTAFAKRRSARRPSDRADEEVESRN
jgi:hypothetical protein